MKFVGNSEFGFYVRVVRNIERFSLEECWKLGVWGVNEFFVNDDFGEL